MTGALLGGLFLGLSPTITDLFPTIGGLLNLMIGVAAVLLGRNPNGLAGAMFEAGRQVLGRGESEDAPAEQRQVAIGDEDEDFEEVTVVGAS